MIELLARPERVLVGTEAQLTIRVANQGSGPCSKIRIDLHVPGSLGLRRGTRNLRLPQLGPAASHEEPLVVLPREEGTYLISVPNLSYLDELGIPHRERDVTIPVVVDAAPEPETAAGPEGSIFISYRRSDTEAVARSLAQDLSRTFPHRVFFDHTSLRPGDLFRPRLDRELAACEIMLALIGPQWLQSLTEREDKGIEDLVRHEIATGLHRPDLILIPVLIEGADVPPSRRLGTISGLVDRQTTRLGSDTPTGRADLVAKIGGLWRRR